MSRSTSEVALGSGERPFLSMNSSAKTKVRAAIKVIGEQDVPRVRTWKSIVIRVKFKVHRRIRLLTPVDWYRGMPMSYRFQRASSMGYHLQRSSLSLLSVKTFLEETSLCTFDDLAKDATSSHFGPSASMWYSIVLRRWEGEVIPFRTSSPRIMYGCTYVMMRWQTNRNALAYAPLKRELTIDYLLYFKAIYCILIPKDIEFR